MKCIPCIEWYSKETKSAGDVDLLAEVCMCNKIDAKKMSEYSQLLAHSYAIYDSVGYEKDEISSCINKKDGRKNYCSSRYKSNDEAKLVCEICEYSKQYLGKRAELERTVLYYLIAHNNESSRYQGAEKNMFVSKMIIKRPGDIGRWPIIEFYREIFNFIFINTFSGIVVTRENFLETFLQYIFANIPLLAKKYEKKQEDVRDAFSKVAGIFINNYKEIREDEYDAALKCISVPYKEFLKTLNSVKISCKSNQNKSPRAQEKNSSGTGTKKQVVDLEIPKELKQSMDKLLHLDTSLVSAYAPITPQRKNSLNKNEVPSPTPEHSTNGLSHNRLPEKKANIGPIDTRGDDVRDTKPATLENVSIEKASDTTENCEHSLPMCTSSLLLLDGTDTREINDSVMSELIVRIVRSRTLILEVARFNSETGIAFYPDYSASVYFSSDMESIKSLLKQVPRGCILLTFDSKFFLCYLRKYSVCCDRASRLICLKLLYNTKRNAKVDNLQDIAYDIIGEDEQIDSPYKYFMFEQRIYFALWERLMTPAEISSYECREIVNRAQSFSYHFSDSVKNLISISDYQEQAGVRCFKIKIETTNISVWKKNISKIICRLYMSRVFESFRLYIGECNNCSMVLHFLSPYKDELIDTMWHILSASIGKEVETKLDLSIIDLTNDNVFSGDKEEHEHPAAS